MASLLRLPLGGAVLLSLLTGFARAKVDPAAQPLSIPYGDNGTVGPDGPWWFIPQAIDFPDQIVQLLPTTAGLSLIVNKDACDDSTTCPLPLPKMWEQGSAWEMSGGNITISDDVDATQYDSDLQPLLGLEGRGRFFQNRFTVYRNGEPSWLDGVGMMLSDSMAATFPGGQSYTFDTGLFSLSGESAASWNAENGTQVTFNRTLPTAYNNGVIPSTSYGLHVGSVQPSMSPSLVLGGYDSSRVLSDPIVSETDTFTLNTLGISSVGGYQYYGEPEASDNYLTTPGMEVALDPGAPYMYLPKPTCDKIAKYLPVNYNKQFNLYVWDKSGDYEAYQSIVSTLHFMTFGFASSNNRTQKIKVPFGVLNLTLESPLVSDPLQYWPCSPLQNGQKPTLGRAFLQAAFLGQNWDAGRTFLAQAPGPDGQSEYIQAIASDDTLLTPATNPPSWASTWTSTLPPWKDGSSNGGGGGSSNGSGSAGSGGLSRGVVAGIAVGCIALLAIIVGLSIWLFRRYKRRQSWTKPTDTWKNPVELSDGSRSSRAAVRSKNSYAHAQELPVEIFEVDDGRPRQEMDSHGQQIVEMPGERWSRYDRKG